jgi:hypothetical protein
MVVWLRTLLFLILLKRFSLAFVLSLKVRSSRRKRTRNNIPVQAQQRLELNWVSGSRTILGFRRWIGSGFRNASVPLKIITLHAPFAFCITQVVFADPLAV